MQKKNILLIHPFFSLPLVSGGHQGLYNSIRAICNDMSLTLVYEADDDDAYRKAEKVFLSKVPNVRLCPLLKKPRKPTFWQRVGYRARIFVEHFFCIEKPVDIDDVGHVNWWKRTITPSSRMWIEHVSNICKQNKFDIIQVEMPWRISDIFILPDNVKKVFVHHELGFVRRELEMNQMKSFKDYTDVIRNFVDLNEISQLNKYDAIITVSPIDTQKLKDKGVLKPVFSSFSVLDVPALENTIIGDGKRLTFIGPEFHNPNYVGITWFLDNCWSHLKLLDEGMTLDIIGNWSDARKQEYSSKYPGVHFLGFVDDINTVIQGSTMIVPITVGSGIRMKILEASSKGVPFVSTTVGAEGIPVTDGKDCFLTDNPETFIQDILKLQNPTLRQKFMANAYQMVKSHYSIESLRENRLDIYKKI